MPNRPNDRKVASREEAAKFLQAEIANLEAKNKSLTQEKAALIQEFIRADDNDAPEAVRRNLKRLTLPALDVLEELMTTAKSEGVRSSIAKYVIDRGLMPTMVGGDPAAKELKAMLAEMAED